MCYVNLLDRIKPLFKHSAAFAHKATINNVKEAVLSKMEIEL